MADSWKLTKAWLFKRKACSYLAVADDGIPAEHCRPINYAVLDGCAISTLLDSTQNNLVICVAHCVGMGVGVAGDRGFDVIHAQ